MSILLKVQDLCKSYGGIRAVHNVSFNLETGELLALIGPNGAGKTTCFNMLMGQLRPDSGEISLDGVSLLGLPARKIWRLGVGRTFQITATYPSMTVIENCQMALISHYRQLYSIKRRAHRLHDAEAEALLELVALTSQAQRPAAELAYGDLKRLELAIALANKPRLLLMDEPTAGMAPSERIKLMQLTSEIVKEQGCSVLFTEHDMDVVFAHAHRIMVMNRGEIIANGSVADIQGNKEVQDVYLGGGSLFTETGDRHA